MTWNRDSELDLLKMGRCWICAVNFEDLLVFFQNKKKIQYNTSFWTVSSLVQAEVNVTTGITLNGQLTILLELDCFFLRINQIDIFDKVTYFYCASPYEYGCMNMFVCVYVYGCLHMYLYLYVCVTQKIMHNCTRTDMHARTHCPHKLPAHIAYY